MLIDMVPINGGNERSFGNEMKFLPMTLRQILQKLMLMLIFDIPVAFHGAACSILRQFSSSQRPQNSEEDVINKSKGLLRSLSPSRLCRTAFCRPDTYCTVWNGGKAVGRYREDMQCDTMSM